MCLLVDRVASPCTGNRTFCAGDAPRPKPGEAICCFVVVVVVVAAAAAAVVLVLCPCPCQALVIVGKYGIKSFFEAWNLEGQ